MSTSRREGERSWDGQGAVADWWNGALQGSESAGRGVVRDLGRWLRPDGSVLFGPPGRSTRRLGQWEEAVRRARDARAARVVSWWRPRSRIATGLPLDDAPASSGAGDAPAWAILREHWLPGGGVVGVVQPSGSSATTIEVAGRGVRWLASRWTSQTLPEVAAGARASHLAYSAAGPGADVAEWSFAAGPVEVVRSAVLVRSPGLALLMQTETPPPGPVSEARWGLADGVEATPDPASRALILRAGRGRPAARLIPLGLPPSDYPTDRGSLVVEGGEVVLRQSGEGPSRCLALLVSWDARPPVSWRPLTVAEDSAAVGPGVALAARVGFGTGRAGVLVYRSLGPAALRSVLGHQTRARFLVGAFEPTGAVRPWIKATGPLG